MNSGIVVLAEPRVSLCGSAALLLDAEGPLALPTQERIWRLSDRVRGWNGVIDVQPGMNSLLVVLDPVDADPPELSARLLEVWPAVEAGRIAGRPPEGRVGCCGARGEAPPALSP